MPALLLRKSIKGRLEPSQAVPTNHDVPGGRGGVTSPSSLVANLGQDLTQTRRRDFARDIPNSESFCESRPRSEGARNQVRSTCLGGAVTRDVARRRGESDWAALRRRPRDIGAVCHLVLGKTWLRRGEATVVKF